MHRPTVFIIGAGMVGATAAQSLAIKEVARDIVLIDIAQDLARGQAMDINHAAAYTHGVRVRTGTYADIAENDIVVITCGVPQQPGQSRRELVGANAAIIEEVVRRVMAQGKPVFIIMVTNPVDVLTQVALRVSGLPKERVFGTGTVLDTARLRVTLANRLHVSQRDIEAYVLGEHGDASFAALSRAGIGGVPLQDFPGFTPELADGIERDIRAAAYDIIQAKKATYYGIGNVIAEVVGAVLHDAQRVLPVCSLAQGEYGLHDIVLGLPSLVSAKGARILEGYPLSSAERQKLQAAAEAVQETLQLCKKSDES